MPPGEGQHKHGACGEQCEACARAKGSAQLGEAKSKSAHDPSRGQHPLQTGGRHDRPSSTLQVQAPFECGKNTGSNREEKDEFDADSGAQSVKGPKVGVAQFGQCTKGHSGKEGLDDRRSLREGIAQKQPSHTLGLNHQGRGKRDGDQGDQMHGAKGDLTHLIFVCLDARKPAEQHAVAELAQHGDGLSHEVHGAVVQACLARGHLFTHKVQVDFRGRIRQEVEGGAAEAIPQQLPDA